MGGSLGYIFDTEDQVGFSEVIDGEDVGLIGGLAVAPDADAVVADTASFRYLDCVRCAGIGNSSMTFLFELHGAGADDLRASGEEVSVHVAEARGRPQRVPDAIVAQFEAFEGRVLRRRAEAAE